MEQSVSGVFRFVVSVETVGDEPLSDTPGGFAPARALSRPSSKRTADK